jgi:hypothetical protein
VRTDEKKTVGTFGTIPGIEYIRAGEGYGPLVTTVSAFRMPHSRFLYQ